MAEVAQIRNMLSRQRNSRRNWAIVGAIAGTAAVGGLVWAIMSGANPINLRETHDYNDKQLTKTRPVQYDKTGRVVYRQLRIPDRKGHVLKPIPNLGRQTTAQPLEALQSTAPAQNFHGMEKSKMSVPLTSIPNVTKTTMQSQRPQATFTANEIKQGLNQAAMANTDVVPVETRHKRGNGWQNEWLHGHVNTQTDRSGPVVTTKTIWQEFNQ
jgi:hypothetical protein